MKQVTYKYKSKAAAITWGLFLGGFGAHRFYLGNPMVGLMFLMMTFASLPFMSIAVSAAVVILCVMDLIYIALQDKEYFKRESGYTEVQS
jgi:TM2 domain-containing membrane protein YozV